MSVRRDPNREEREQQRALYYLRRTCSMVLSRTERMSNRIVTVAGTDMRGRKEENRKSTLRQVSAAALKAIE